MTEYVKNGVGEVIGRIEEDGNGTTYVYNEVGEMNGRCENGQTYDRVGNVVSYSENPSMLIDKS